MARHVLFILAFGLLFSASAADKAPKLKPDKTAYDFGKVVGAESVAGKFKLTNVGNAPLKFGEPQVSCGCTAATIKPEILEPGQSAELEFTLNMPAARTSLHKEITVISNDPQSPELTLTLIADFTPEYEFSPRIVNLAIHEGALTNLDVRLTRNTGQAIKVEKLETSGPWITAESKAAGSNSVAISLRIEPSGGPRAFSELLRVYSPHTNTPVAMLQIIGRVIGDMVVAPDSLFWAFSDPDQINRDTFTIRKLVASPSLPDQDFEIKSASSSIPEVAVSFTRRGGVYDLEAKLTKIPATSTQGVIKIELKGSKPVVIDLPVKIYVPQSLAQQLLPKANASK